MPPTTRPRDPDRRPSIRIRLAAKLIKRGDDPTEVARACKIPPALLEFIAEHPTSTTATNYDPGPGSRA